MASLSVLPKRDAFLWSLEDKHEKVANIVVIDPSEVPRYLKILKLWKSIFVEMEKPSRSDRSLCAQLKYIATRDSLSIATRIQLSLWLSQTARGEDRPVVMAATDGRGIMQAMCIAKQCDEVLNVEDLLVAPWNNALCGSLAREESTLDTSKCLFELAKALEVDQDELTRAGKGVGTLMMHAIYEMAQQLSLKAVVLESNPLAFDFYAKLGMHKAAGKHSAFRYDVEKTMAKPLRDKVQDLIGK